jgi:hypothetical protein
MPHPLNLVWIERELRDGGPCGDRRVEAAETLLLLEVVRVKKTEQDDSPHP